MVQVYGVAGLRPEKLKVATVGGRDLLVILLLVEGEGFVRYLEVHVCTAPAAGLALRDEREARPVADRYDVLELVQFLVGGFKVGGRTLAYYVVGLFLVAHLVEHLQGGRQCPGQQLAEGLAREGDDRTRHQPDEPVHPKADVRALARAAPLHGDVALGLQDERG